MRILWLRLGCFLCFQSLKLAGGIALLLVCIAALAPWQQPAVSASEPPTAGAPKPLLAGTTTAVAARSVLDDNLLVTWYGNPRTARMGILGGPKGAELAAGLRKQADAYARLTEKNILPAYHIVAVIAQPTAGRDGMFRRRETNATIRALLEQARAHGFKLVLDIQPGRSTVGAELEYLRPHLEQPDVYLALDPEFAMAKDEVPGQKIGSMGSKEVNEAIAFLDAIIQERGLPPKVLIVHQFTHGMLQDKQHVHDSPLVDVVLTMDGLGDRPLKRATYRMVIKQRPLEFAGIKLFYKQDTSLFGPQEVMMLQPEPSVIIYQ